MQIAQVLAGFSLGEADLLRRAMGKKIKAEMAAQRDRFVTGAAERGLDKARADEIFDLLAKFADYGFNKSHAAAYALIAYRTAWFKANYPVEFLSSSMTLDKSNTDKLAEFCNEARRLKIAVLPPSVRTSGANFEPAECTGEPAIRYALSAIKGVGEAQARRLAAINGSSETARPSSAAFHDLTDFAARVNPRDINKRMLESLTSAGAFDELEPNRARVFAGAEAILAAAQRHQDEQLAGQSVLFGAENLDPIVLPKVEPWPLTERLRHEFELVGFFYPAIRSTPMPQSSRGCGCSAGPSSPARSSRARPPRGLPRPCLSGTSAGPNPARKWGSLTSRINPANMKQFCFRKASINIAIPWRKAPPCSFACKLPLKARRCGLASSRWSPWMPRQIGSARGCAFFCATKIRLARSRGVLSARGDGEVSLVLLTSSGEVEIKLPGKFSVSPQVAGALKAIPGIVAVEHV